VQFFPTERLEVFASSTYNRGTATITGLNYDPGVLGVPIPGLDFNLMNASFADFSDLRIRQVVHTAGITYRLTSNLLLTGTAEYHDYRDSQPYVFDTTGRRVFTYAGLSWVF
jgi:hypothetical protein